MKNASKQKNLGQYFTEDITLLGSVFSFIKNNPIKILEPAVGKGHVVDYVLERCPEIEFDMFEIDATLQPLHRIDKNKVNYKDFLKSEIHDKYDTIIGNPPFIRKKTGNLYIEFIKKCYALLNIGGELIFIVPSDFFKLTSSVEIIEDMLLSGTFTDIYHPNKENLFKGASIDVLVFRYCKDPNLPNDVIYNGENMKLINNNGLITFSQSMKQNENSFSDIFTIYVGLVSGKEEVYKNSTWGNIEVLNGENEILKYIFTETFPTNNHSLNEYLLKHKDQLMCRKIKVFSEGNWFQWGAPRNITAMREYLGKSCIYVYNLTRKVNVAFIGKVQYFGGGLLMMLPKEEMSLESLKNCVDYLNSEEFKQSFTFSGRFKIGHRQLCNSQM